MKNNSAPPGLARKLVLDEIFDLTLYKRLHNFASGETKEMLGMLIEVETRHVKFWQDFFKLRLEKLGWGRRLELSIFVLFARIFGEKGIHLILEAIEIHGIRKYLSVWDVYKDIPLGEAVKGILMDEFKHEDEIVSRAARRKIHPERVRNIFLGFNDGLVEMIGAVSGFFAAFQTVSSVLIAGFTVAVAGSLSMAASAFAGASSEYEMENTEMRRSRFLGEGSDGIYETFPFTSAFIVGISYFLGAVVPLLPLFFGAGNLALSISAALVIIILVSYIIAFISGMSVSKRIATNIIVIVVAVSITYVIGLVAKNVLGISV